MEDLKSAYPDDLVAINIFRPDFDNGLTPEQKAHKTEVDLDDYDKFDVKIINTTLENYGGGGHATAGGCNTIDEETFRRLIYEHKF